ncbi:SAM-dependent methyltransferase [Streptomyces sp. SP18BB07]|uniref:SAM-dependent methyltransferase n=1 Tax=Streptomyces sp. SP18BB07 TaxID=3002522 RepID=UPI002E7815B3|nr:SAM-dependent methyltransferase [Streptomyces sp. SP18BB07]
MDFDQPIAITMMGVLNFVMDTDEAEAIVRRLVNAVPPGSHLVISHPTTEVDGEAMTQAVNYWNEQGSAPMTLRSHADLVRLFGDVEVLSPGIAPAPAGAREPTTRTLTSLTSAVSG